MRVLLLLKSLKLDVVLFGGSEFLKKAIPSIVLNDCYLNYNNRMQTLCKYRVLTKVLKLYVKIILNITCV